MDAFPLLLTAVLALAAGLGLGLAIGRRSPVAPPPDVAEPAAEATARAVAPVRESLDRFDARLRQLEASRIEWHSQLREQVEAVRTTSDSLRRETASLATALRRPQVRGRWGEMHLKRTAELAGLVEHCDFDLQVTTADGTLRPDMVVHLAGGKNVVVDAKVPLDAYLDAVEASEPDVAQVHVQRHVRQLRTHVDQLAAKSYWSRLEHSPEFVVLFVPAEAFLAEALAHDPSLLEHAAAKQVVLATPTTLIALLRTVAHAWTQERLADNAREIQRVAAELYERIGVVGGHVDALGKALANAVTSYNDTVGSVESRLLVTARRLHDLDIGTREVTAPRRVETGHRAPTAPELVERLSS
ncbi:DNA recombination protein RmuC [Aeromicrobium sp. IC_218]|uniref:DNA recombination protein RmuC n=1 Tax=Aeromicrobium sp. IC_218 TaxID=2545468 RepID=UPI00103BE692|nr:DNA recombination protein RmuC [Aeromicrobium sp. IC_218]TCI98795.1 DNA recombination protein RmuC [Aeromicrobium sp. IC_218]